MTLARRNRESDLEAYFVQRVKDLGGKAVKFAVPGEAGHPDRLVKLPGTPAFLVELKKRGKEPEPLQMQRMQEWRDAGMLATWANDKLGVELALGVLGRV
jgi:hypothetical protein